MVNFSKTYYSEHGQNNIHNRIFGLDILRAFAILFVVAGHGTIIFNPKILDRIVYHIFGYEDKKVIGCSMRANLISIVVWKMAINNIHYRVSIFSISTAASNMQSMSLVDASILLTGFTFHNKENIFLR